MSEWLVNGKTIYRVINLRKLIQSDVKENYMDTNNSGTKDTWPDDFLKSLFFLRSMIIVIAHQNINDIISKWSHLLIFNIITAKFHKK